MRQYRQQTQHIRIYKSGRWTCVNRGIIYDKLRKLKLYPLHECKTEEEAKEMVNALFENHNLIATYKPVVRYKGTSYEKVKYKVYLDKDQKVVTESIKRKK